MTDISPVGQLSVSDVPEEELGYVLLPRENKGPQYDEIRRVGARALEVLGMQTGLTHMEWFRRRDGSVAISEVAARPPGAQITNLLSHAHETESRVPVERAVCQPLQCHGGRQNSTAVQDVGRHERMRVGGDGPLEDDREFVRTGAVLRVIAEDAKVHRTLPHDSS